MGESDPGVISLRDICCGGDCLAPLLPAQFEASILDKKFTRGKDDRPLVTKLYTDMFHEHFRVMKELYFLDSGWGNADFAQLCDVLGSGALPMLETLKVDTSNISDIGPIGPVLAKLPALRKLWLRKLKVDHIAPLTEALRSGAATKLK